MAQPARDGGLFASLGAVVAALMVGALVAVMVSYGGGIGPLLQAPPRPVAAAPHAPTGAG